MGSLAKAGTMKMLNLKSSVERFLADEAGATAIEYALIAVGISVAILAAVQALGGSVSSMYDTIAEKVSAQMAP